MNAAAIAICSFGICFGVVKVTGEYLSLPVVSVDAVSGECVRIESPAGDIPCSRMPANYVSQIVYSAPANSYRSPREVSQVQP